MPVAGIPFRRRGRPAFTLVEMVVTVGMIAVLAAFVVPSVLRRADSADPVKVAHDLNSIGTAIQNFAADVKGALPGDIEDLTAPIQVNASCNALNPCDSTVTHAETYTQQQVLLWKGPYLAASIAPRPSATIRTGFTADVQNVLLRYDAVTGVPELCPAPSGTTFQCAGFVETNPLFVAVTVVNLTREQALQVNAIIDGPNELQPDLEGRFRFTSTGSPAHFLAAPIAQQ